MAKIIYKGLVPADHPIYKQGFSAVSGPGIRINHDLIKKEEEEKKKTEAKSSKTIRKKDPEK